MWECVPCRDRSFLAPTSLQRRPLHLLHSWHARNSPSDRARENILPLREDRRRHEIGLPKKVGGGGRARNTISFPFFPLFQSPVPKGRERGGETDKKGGKGKGMDPGGRGGPLKKDRPPSPPRLRVTVTKLVYACMEWTNSPLLSATPTCLSSERPPPSSCWQRRLGRFAFQEFGCPFLPSPLFPPSLTRFPREEKKSNLHPS